RVRGWGVGSGEGQESLVDAAFPGQAPAQGGLGLDAGLVSLDLLGYDDCLSTHLDRFVGLVLKVETCRKSRAGCGKVAARAKRLQHLPRLHVPGAGLLKCGQLPETETKHDQAAGSLFGRS